MKTSIFASLAAELKPSAVLATNTSSISITKMAAAAIPSGETVTSEKGRSSTARVVGELQRLFSSGRLLKTCRSSFFQSGTCHGKYKYMITATTS